MISLGQVKKKEMAELSAPGIETARKLGLLEEEYDNITKILGREPNFTELSVFSVMWSEHCSYKNSIFWLKTLPRDGGKLLVGAGEENAGLVDIGDGLACAFKIESHNHPSAIEPYQGAATGVGGIHRDIFTMGARPIAALNSLRFGDIANKRTRHLVKGVVAGIGDYGNCFGVPTVGGEVYFYPCYNQNILVNAMSAGIVKVGHTVSASADGPGNPVFIVGSATGKDGIHGATFASADLTEDSAEDLPSVQVGDPFQEKLLLEASLEAIQTGAVVGMQDMGAAGISCSSSEMSAKSGTGMRLDLEKVPMRQANMQPFELLLSESQERMLIVGKRGEEDKLQAVFDKWDLVCVEIGEVTNSGRVEYFWHGERVVDIPAESLVLGGGAPVYQRPYRVPDYIRKVKDFNPEHIPVPSDLPATARAVYQSPNLLSKHWIYDQYDGTVRSNSLNTVWASDAALVRIKGTRKALALTTDCNSAYVYADPYKGTMIAVAEAARNIVCSGGEPLAITNCLNFGNPYNEEVYWQFVYAIQGMGEACRRFNTPVTGGNVSFYNQSVTNEGTEPVYPTPTIGMMGLLEDVDQMMTLHFREEGHGIYLLGKSRGDIGSSEYLRVVHGVDHSPAPHFLLEEECALHKVLKALLRQKLVRSAHDVSEGGLFACLLESAMAGNMGFEIAWDEKVRKDAFLFGESQSRVAVSVAEEDEEEFCRVLDLSGLPYQKLGTTGGDRLVIGNEDFGDLRSWQSHFQNRLEELLNAD